MTQDENLMKWMMDWYNLAYPNPEQKPEKKEDVWTVLPDLPNVAFLNLEFKSQKFSNSESDINEITITMQCDNFEML